MFRKVRIIIQPTKHCTKTLLNMLTLILELNSHFIVGGDFNTEHHWSSSRLANQKGKGLSDTFQIIIQYYMKIRRIGRVILINCLT